MRGWIDLWVILVELTLFSSKSVNFKDFNAHRNAYKHLFHMEVYSHALYYRLTKLAFPIFACSIKWPHLRRLYSIKYLLVLGLISGEFTCSFHVPPYGRWTGVFHWCTCWWEGQYHLSSQISAYVCLLIVRLCHHPVVASMSSDLQSNLREKAVARNVLDPKTALGHWLGYEFNSMCHQE